MISLSKIVVYGTIIIVLLFPHYSFGQFINGDFNSGLSGWNTYGDITAEPGVAILRTGGIYGLYDTSLSATFIVSGERLNFKYYFDVSGPDDILSPDFPSYPYDSFQVSLDAGSLGYFVQALAWQPVDILTPFSLDISFLDPGTSAMLSFDLLDQDDGYSSIAAIDDITDPPATVPESGTLMLMGSGLIGIFVFNRYRGNFARLLITISILFTAMILGNGIAHGELIEENVDGMIRLDFTSPVFNTSTNTLTLNMTVTNISDMSIRTPLKVIITNISTTDVIVAHPDGFTAEGLPYLDLSGSVADHELSAGEASPYAKISFYNPRRVKFRWDQDVLAFVDVFTQKGPVIENVCFAAGEMPAVCEFNQYDFEVKEPEFDKLLQRQLPEMYRYEQVRVYAYDYEELPVRVTINGADAFYNEEGFYYYSDLVLSEGLNTVSIYVTNETGMAINRDISLNVDISPPNIDILQPVYPSVVTSQEVIITGTIDDPAVEKVSLIKGFISREDVPVSGGQFEANISLLPGHNNITVEATDLAGNSISKDIDVVYVFSETGVVSGYISNSVIGLPVSGAAITFRSENAADTTVISDETGMYRIEDAHSGDVTLLVEKDGYEAKSIKICVLGGGVPLLQNITLQPVSSRDTFTLTGQIKNTAGLPLSGVRISIAGLSLTATSESNGVYQVSGIPRNSFTAEASADGFDSSVVNINADVYSSGTSILVYDFILNEFDYAISISYPENGENLAGEKTIVKGFIRSRDREVGIRVNGVLANIYNDYFVANSVPLLKDKNTIIAEMMDESGTIVSDSIEVFSSHIVNGGTLINARETGIVPSGVKVIIEEPPDISFVESNLDITGPSAAQLMSEGRLHYTVLINEPGIYLLTFRGVDSGGNNYIEEFEFTGRGKEAVENMLQGKWIRFKNLVVNNNIEGALSMITPDTRARYEEQFRMAGSGLVDSFNGIGDIQLVTLSDNMAKARVYLDDVTHYVWFARDIYGMWKINKF